MSAAPWIAAYSATLVTWLASLLMRNEPTLWKGRSLVWLNAMFLVAAAATQIARGSQPDSALLGFEAFLLITAALVTNLWILLHIRHAEIEKVLEKCFGKTLAKYSRADDGYSVLAGTGEMKVTLARLGPVMRIRFMGAKGSRKAELIKSVFSKQFKTAFPKPRFRT